MTEAGSIARVGARIAKSTRIRARNLRARVFDTESLVVSERTPYRVIHESGIARVRYYPPLEADSIVIAGETVAVQKTPHPVPLVLVAPLAVNMSIYDLFPDRSLVAYLRARGFELYLFDWGRPDAAHDHHRIATYVDELMPELLAKVREHAGTRRVSLHGWSFGGLFSYAYTAAARDADIVNLALIGAPCDYHANGELGRQYQRLARVARTVGFRPHALSSRLLRSPGWANSLAFKLTSPVASVLGYVELLSKLHDREFVSAHATNGAFLDDMVAYPGGVMQDIMQSLWIDNILAGGRLPVGDWRARLSDVHANLLVVVGDDDVIVTRDCAKPLVDLCSSADRSILDVPGGHMGILGGSRAPKAIWPQVADWLASRSA